MYLSVLRGPHSQLQKCLLGSEGRKTTQNLLRPQNHCPCPTFVVSLSLVGHRQRRQREAHRAVRGLVIRERAAGPGQVGSPRPNLQEAWWADQGQGIGDPD